MPGMHELLVEKLTDRQDPEAMVPSLSARQDDLKELFFSEGRIMGGEGAHILFSMTAIPNLFTTLIECTIVIHCLRLIFWIF